MKVFDIAKQMVEYFDQPYYLDRSKCCPKMTEKKAFTFWPRPKQGNGLILEETLDLALKFFQTKFKLQGFNYKVSKKTKYLTLL